MSDIPLGIGSPEEPLYGVLDTEQNFFYVVSCYPEIMEKATTLLSAHRPVELMLITDAVNWEYNLIDNTVCSNWGIAYTPDKTCVNTNIEHSEETKFLINNLLTFLAGYQKVYYFQQNIEDYCRGWVGMLLPGKELCEQFASDPWFNKALAKELDNYNRTDNMIKEDFNKVLSIYDLDIASADYAEQIKNKLSKVTIYYEFNNYFL